MRRIPHIISSTSGETFIETLASILISGLSLLLLMTAALNASAMVKQARSYEDRYEEQRAHAEATDESFGTGSVSFGGEDYPVKLYGGDAIASYRLQEG